MKKEEKRRKIEECLQKIEEIIGKPDCNSCTHKCCLNSGFGIQRGPIVDEIYGDAISQNETKHIRIGIRKIPVLKTENNACIRFENGKCTKYNERPLECRLYPITLNEKGEIVVAQCPGIKLDEKSEREVKNYTREIFKLAPKFYKRLKLIKEDGILSL